MRYILEDESGISVEVSDELKKLSLISTGWVLKQTIEDEKLDAWDAVGTRQIRFNNGDVGDVPIKYFVVDRESHPIAIVAQSGMTYPWTSIMSIGPVKK